MRVIEFERRKRGWSQSQLSEIAGVRQADISAIEIGRLVPSALQADRLGKAMGIPADMLLHEVGPYIAEAVAQ